MFATKPTLDGSTQTRLRISADINVSPRDHKPPLFRNLFKRVQIGTPCTITLPCGLIFSINNKSLNSSKLLTEWRKFRERNWWTNNFKISIEDKYPGLLIIIASVTPTSKQEVHARMDQATEFAESLVKVCPSCGVLSGTRRPNSPVNKHGISNCALKLFVIDIYEYMPGGKGSLSCFYVV